MEGKKDEDQDINRRLPVQEDRPIGFLLFGVEEKAGKDLDPEEEDQEKTADSMK